MERLICNVCSGGKKWLPTPISRFESYLERLFDRGSTVLKAAGIRKNVAYNLQYLQYIHQSLAEFKTTSVIITQSWKTSVIVGTSILEAISYYLVLSRGLQRSTVWIEQTRTSSNFQLDGEQFQLESVVSKKADVAIQVEMTFEQVIRRMEEKKLLGPDHDIYKKMQFLRKLRNRVHLQLTEGAHDSDWTTFNAKEINTLREVLYTILTGALFNPSKDEEAYFEFLHMRAGA